jgi:hypothetical protein
MFCISLFVLLYFFFWPLCCLFFDIQILIAPLVLLLLLFCWSQLYCQLLIIYFIMKGLVKIRMWKRTIWYWVIHCWVLCILVNNCIAMGTYNNVNSISNVLTFDLKRSLWQPVRTVISERWHLTHIWETLTWPHHFYYEGWCRSIKLI